MSYVRINIQHVSQVLFFLSKRWGNVESFSESFTSMDLCSSLLASCLSSSLIKPPQLLTSSLITNSIVPNCSGRKRQSRHVLKASAGPFSYQKFIHFALDETKRRTLLVPSPLQVLFHFLLTFFSCIIYGKQRWVGFVWIELFSSVCIEILYWVLFLEGWKWIWALVFELQRSSW